MIKFSDFSIVKYGPSKSLMWMYVEDPSFMQTVAMKDNQYA